MAESHSKRSIRRVQVAHRFVNTATSSKPDSSRIKQIHTISHLPQVKGKTLKALEFISAPEYQGMSLSFQDNTFLDLKFETFLTVKADYLDQKTGKRRMLRQWTGKHRR